MAYGATTGLPPIWSRIWRNLNRDLQVKHAGRPWSAVRADFERTHAEILEIVEALPEERLLRAGHFVWTGKNPLTTYLGANTASHYRFAIGVLKRWRRA